jgi:hypothetical protein
MTDQLARVTSEPLVYTREGRNSWFRDLALYEATRDDDATERLTRYARECEVEKRTTPNNTLGTGGEFTPPAWLEPLFAVTARSGRPFADTVTNMPLPAGVQQVNIPSFWVGNANKGQANNQAAAEKDATTFAATSNVVTIAGFADVSIQAHEQGPNLDAAFLQDLIHGYNAELERQIFNGVTGQNELPGILNLTTGSAVGNVPTNAKVDGTGINTFTGLWPLVGQAAAQVGNNRKQQATHIALAPRRWAWIASSLDSSNRPMTQPDTRGPDDQPTLIGYPVITTGGINAGNTNDAIFTLRPAEMFLFESADHVQISAPNAGTLTTRIRFYRYVAFVGNRRPEGIAWVNNLPQPTNF